MKKKDSLPKPAVTTPFEIFTNERKAEFLLSNAVDKQDYEWAVKEIKKLVLDPDQIPNRRPGKR